MVFKTDNDVNYLERKPKRIYWEVVAGKGLSQIQKNDLIFDNYDCKIRQLPRMFDI